MTNSKVYALVPIKENSERVVGKNRRIIAGKPLLFWVLHTLTQCKNIDEIIVDVDSVSLQKMVLDLFPEILCYIRKKEVFGTNTPMNMVINSRIQEYNKTDIFVQTHVTNPFLKSKTIDNAIELFRASNCDSMFSVTQHQKRFYTADVKPVNHDLNKMENTQDMQALYEENSNMFLFTKESFDNNGKNRIGKNPNIIKMNALESLDIDTEEDWKVAEILMGYKDVL